MMVMEAAIRAEERETNDIIKSIRINSNCFVRRAIILSFWIYEGNSTAVPAPNETEIIGPMVAGRVQLRTSCW